MYLILNDVSFPYLELQSEEILNDQVFGLMSKVDALIFAIDVKRALLPTKEFEMLRRELELFMLCQSDLPLLILCCHDESLRELDLNIVVSKLGLDVQTQRSWGIFNVDASSMKGLDTAFTWVLQNVTKN